MEIIGLPSAVLVQGGAFALLMAVFWLVFTGRLVPRSQLDDARADRDMWREAHATEKKINEEYADLLAAQLESTRTIEAFMAALPPPPERAERHRPSRGGRP